MSTGAIPEPVPMCFFSKGTTSTGAVQNPSPPPSTASTSIGIQELAAQTRQPNREGNRQPQAGADEAPRGPLTAPEPTFPPASQAQASQSQDASLNREWMENLKRLGALLDDGLVTQAEFEAEKARLLPKEGPE